MLLLSLIFSFAFAQSQHNVTNIDFEGQEVNGKHKKPGITLTNKKPSTPFNSLLKPRKEFLNEMIDSCDDFE